MTNLLFRSRITTLLYNQAPMKEVLEVSFLGFMLQRDGLWGSHVSGLCTKLSKTIFLLRRAQVFVSRSVMVLLYKTLFLPNMTYGIAV